MVGYGILCSYILCIAWKSFVPQHTQAHHHAHSIRLKKRLRAFATFRVVCASARDFVH